MPSALAAQALATINAAAANAILKASKMHLRSMRKHKPPTSNRTSLAKILQVYHWPNPFVSSRLLIHPPPPPQPYMQIISVSYQASAEYLSIRLSECPGLALGVNSLCYFSFT